MYCSVVQLNGPLTGDGEDCGLSKRAAVSGFRGAGACRGVGQPLWSTTKLCADVPRRT